MVEPFVLDAAPDYLVVYKPPRMHSAPLKKQEDPRGNGPAGETLLDWCAARYPELRNPRGRQVWEGGLLHRLDYETRGLVLLARNQAALESLLAQQEAGLFIKEYEALGSGERTGGPLPGFPPYPPSGETAPPGIIRSAFRSYGPGGRVVRPVTFPGEGPAPGKGKAAMDRGAPYETEITAWTDAGGCRLFRLRIRRGFRHQIRCHLAWTGWPLLNDPLYGGPSRALPPPGEAGTGPLDPPPFSLGLLARRITFFDPPSGAERSYRL
jgi:23S rRNA pseudouridine1911/1915/1917 synthase